MVKFVTTLFCAATCLLGTVENVDAGCRGNFRLEFGYTSDVQVAMERNSNCPIIMQFDYVALYGLSVRQKPKNGTVHMPNHYTFVYTPRKGFVGQDSFIVDAEGGYVSWATGTATMRSKAGMAITATVQ